ncbi:MAG TPA: hypothetical protein VGC19_05995 [Rhodanobacter sp.]
MTLKEVAQDDYITITNHSANRNVYVTRGVGNCFAFGITFSDDLGNHAIFAHYNPRYWTPGYAENERFAGMVNQLEGKTNVAIEVVTAMLEATKKTTVYATDALNGARPVNFYYANPGKAGAVDVNFFPEHAVLWADATLGSEARRQYNDESAELNKDSFKLHVPPRCCSDIITKSKGKKSSNHCIIL